MSRQTVVPKVNPTICNKVVSFCRLKRRRMNDKFWNIIAIIFILFSMTSRGLPMQPLSPGSSPLSAQSQVRQPGQCQIPTNLYLPCMENLLTRSEEHTSELQSQSNLVCRLLLE